MAILIIVVACIRGPFTNLVYSLQYTIVDMSKQAATKEIRLSDDGTLHSSILYAHETIITVIHAQGPIFGGHRTQ